MGWKVHMVIMLCNLLLLTYTRMLRQGKVLKRETRQQKFYEVWRHSIKRMNTAVSDCQNKVAPHRPTVTHMYFTNDLGTHIVKCTLHYQWPWLSWCLVLHSPLLPPLSCFPLQSLSMIHHQAQDQQVVLLVVKRASVSPAVEHSRIVHNHEREVMKPGYIKSF